MRVLYIGIDYYNFENGGGVIRNRNQVFLKKYADYCEIYLIHNYKNKLSLILNALLGRTCGVTGNQIKEIKNIIKSNNITHIYVDSSTIGGLPKGLYKNTKSTVFFHNVEYYYYKAAKSNRCSFFQFMYSFYTKVFFYNEKRICKLADKIITLNMRDSGELKKLYGRNADIIWPTTFTDVYNKNYEYNNINNYLLFVGSDFFGNTEGLFWFIENCMPLINTKLIVIGSGMDKYKNKYLEQNIEFYGFVKDLSPYYYNADAVVLPIISGSGMKTKTCEALMYGKKIFGTKEAFEGYSGIENTECIQCDNKEDFIQKINEYIENKENIKKFSKLSRELFLTNYEESFQMERVFSLLKN